MSHMARSKATAKRASLVGGRKVIRTPPDACHLSVTNCHMKHLRPSCIDLQPDKKYSSGSSGGGSGGDRGGRGGGGSGGGGGELLLYETRLRLTCRCTCATILTFSYVSPAQAVEGQTAAV